MQLGFFFKYKDDWVLVIEKRKEWSAVPVVLFCFFLEHLNIVTSKKTEKESSF
jgi:hypothetical protein